MPSETLPDPHEPENQDAEIWRFMQMWKFRDLIKTGELYFQRADLFDDESEGLPPEKYLPILGLNPLDLRDRQELDHSIGSLAQFREACYICCWHLFREETYGMWKQFGEDGVAICSRYRLLKSALGVLGDRAFLGLVRYGSQDLTGWNALRFVTTKRTRYAGEQEVRALLWLIDQVTETNRHFDASNRAHPHPLTPPPDSVLKGQRRRVALRTLMTEVIINPWASQETFDMTTQLIRNNGYTIPVYKSELTCYREFLPVDGPR
jgi:hypothetical protein